VAERAPAGSPRSGPDDGHPARITPVFTQLSREDRHQELRPSADFSYVPLNRAKAEVPSRKLLAGRHRDVLVFAPLVLLVGLFVTLVPTRMNGQVEDNARRRASGLAKVLGNALAVALEFDDADEATRVLTLLASQKDAVSAVVLDGHARPFAHWPAGNAPAAESLPGGADTLLRGNVLVASVPVRSTGGTAGRLVVSFDAHELHASKRANWIAAIALVLVGGGALAGMLARLFLRRRRAERALADQEAKFSVLVEGMPDALVIFQRGQLSYANSSARRLLELGDKADPSSIRRSDALAAIDIAVDAGDQSRLVEVKAPTGSLHLEVRAFALTVDGHPATISLARDVTEEQRLRERLALSDRLASIGTLATGVAHEINNPLSYILANLDFVAMELAVLGGGTDGPVAPSAEVLAELDTAVRDAQSGAERVQKIVQDMRKMARKDFGERAPIDVPTIVRAAVEQAKVAIGLRAEIEIALAKVPPVMASESQLSQVVVNLVVNAADAILPDSPPDRRHVRVSTGLTEDGWIEIAVSDTGTGIPPEVRDKIFDPFFTTKPVGVGTGLGLAICHGIVRTHGGSLSFDTEVGVGTTMRVRLPASAIAIPVAGVRRSRTETSPGRILVVDDEPAIGSAVARLLKRGDTEFESCARRALERVVAGERFDLVICDVRMPEMNGPELLTALRGRAPDQARAFVFMTGALDERSEADLGRLGVPVLHKPFNRDSLRDFISAQLVRLAQAA
jgi:two-component system, cell cycle sensor histidine kinase and response regulator CckA